MSHSGHRATKNRDGPAASAELAQAEISAAVIVLHSRNRSNVRHANHEPTFHRVPVNDHCWPWLTQRVGFKKAKIALARKLAVVLPRMWCDGTDFIWSAREAAA